VSKSNIIIKSCLCVAVLLTVSFNNSFFIYNGEVMANNGNGNGNAGGNGNGNAGGNGNGNGNAGGNGGGNNGQQCLKSGNKPKGFTPRVPIIIDTIPDIVVHDVFGGDYINKTINLTYTYDTKCAGVICSMDEGLTFASSSSSHDFTVDVALDSQTNCTSFRITGFLPLDADNSATYAVVPAPSITISYIPYNE